MRGRSSFSDPSLTAAAPSQVTPTATPDSISAAPLNRPKIIFVADGLFPGVTRCYDVDMPG